MPGMLRREMGWGQEAEPGFGTAGLHNVPRAPEPLEWEPGPEHGTGVVDGLGLVKIAPFILLYPVIRYVVNRRRARPSVQLTGWKRLIAVLLAAVYGIFAARFLFELFRWAHTR
jgi:hypothetical protein